MTQGLPVEEKFGIVSQLRRAAVSIPANIVEGYVKNSHLDKLRFYNIAQGSVSECFYYLRLVADLGYAKTDDLSQVLSEVSKLLTAYSSGLKRNTAK